ncbi:MAG: hypothetical protein JWQ43_1682 [Glaciihabitans sp.]|nr:hypothetical protein [Glaciihabitans sp.]
MAERNNMSRRPARSHLRVHGFSHAIPALATGLLMLTVLAGCAAPGSPALPPLADATAQSCNSRDLVIGWGIPAAGEPVLSHIYMTTEYASPGSGDTHYAEDGTTQMSSGGLGNQTMVADIPLGPVFTGDGLSRLAGDDADAEAAWRTALVADLRKTGDVASDFGGQTGSPDGAYLTMEMVGGVIELRSIVAESVTTTSVSYSIECAGQVLATGVLTAPDGGSAAVIEFECGHEPAEQLAPGQAGAYLEATEFCEL